MNYDAKIDTDHGRVSDVDGDPLHTDSASEKRGNRRVLIIGLVALAIIIGLWFLSKGTGGASVSEEPGNQAAVVSVIAPGTTTIPGRVEASGTLAARRELPVGAVGEGGRVVRVMVDEGDWVRAGQVLAVVDREVQSQQQASQAAQIQVAQADARLAQSNLDRALKLVDRGFISRADVDRLTATRDAANARVRVAQAQLSELRARTNRLNITAPAAGLVLTRDVEPGQVVGPGSGVLFRIAQGGELEMLAELSEDDLARVPVGVAAEVRPVGTEKVFNGQVWQVSPVIDPENRQGTARIALSYAPELRPGGFASAEIASGTIVAPLLPQSAILSDSDGSYVYIVGDENKVVRRRVQTGTVVSNGIAVTEGLRGTERVVLRAGGFLNPGETIEPKLVKATEVAAR